MTTKSNAGKEQPESSKRAPVGGAKRRPVSGPRHVLACEPADDRLPVHSTWGVRQSSAGSVSEQAAPGAGTAALAFSGSRFAADLSRVPAHSGSRIPPSAGAAPGLGSPSFPSRVTDRHPDRESDEAETEPVAGTSQVVRQASGIASIQRWRWPWSAPEARVIASGPEPEEEPEARSTGVVVEPLEGGGSRAYAPAREEAQQELLDAAQALLDELEGVQNTLAQRNEDDPRIARLDEIDEQARRLRIEIQGLQPPFQADVLSEMEGRLDEIGDRYVAIRGDVLREISGGAEAGERQPDLAAVQARLRANLATHQQLTRQFGTLVESLEAEGERFEGMEQAMQMIRALEAVQSIGNLALMGPTGFANMPSIPGELTVIGGEALSAAGEETGPFVGTAGGSAAGIVQYMIDSGLVDQIARRRAMGQCIREGRGFEACLPLAQMDVGETARRLQTLSRQIEEDARRWGPCPPADRADRT